MIEIESSLLRVQNLVVDFRTRRAVPSMRQRRLRAVDNVSFRLAERETLGVVGESGSGKSTLARALLRLIEPTHGTVEFQGREVTNLSQEEFRPVRRDMQMIFQDPYSSLNPAMTVASLIGEPIDVHERVTKNERNRRVQEALQAVGLSRVHMSRYPYEFSGGQRQRIAIARAIISEPQLLILDEAVSALDVSTRSQIVNLLTGLQERMGLTYLFIGHDLDLVRYVSDQIAVMYFGRVVEIGPANRLFNHPGHPYTASLASAVLVPDPRLQRERVRVALAGEIPNPLKPPQGCAFHERCLFAMDRCRIESPAMRPVTGGGIAACHLHDDGPLLSGGSVLDLADSVTNAVRAAE